MLKETIASGIFGLLVPAYAFHTAYPDGLFEMYDKATFGLYYPEHSKHINITLESNFGMELNTLIKYKAAAETIRWADANTDIIVTVKNNNGGAVLVLKDLEQAMATTSARVIIKLENWGYSCGAEILKYGDLVYLPTDSLTMFHLGSIGLSDGRTIVISTKPNGQIPTEAQPAWAKIVAEATESIQPYREWINKEQYQKILDGDEAFISGKDICTNSHADVVMHTSDGCVIRGVKNFTFSLLEKLAMMKIAGY